MDTFNTTASSFSRPWRIAAAGVAVALALALAACGDDDDDTASGDTTSDTGSASGTAGSNYNAGASTTAGDSGATGAADATLEVTEIRYSDVSAPAGGTLEIVNSSGAPHTFTADDGSFEVEYGPDETVTVDVPDEPGEYPFHCEIHSSMTGTLTVE